MSIQLLVIVSITLLSACGGGSKDSVVFRPGDNSDVQGDITITTSDGKASATFDKDLFTSGTEVYLTNVISTVTEAGLPESRHPIAAVEFTAESGEKAASQDGGTGGSGDGGETETDPSDIGGNVNMSVILYGSSWPGGSTIPVYKWSETVQTWESAGVTATIDADGKKGSFSIAKYGRYALMSPLQSELPPPAGVFVKVIAATKTAVVLDWPASDYSELAGYNLYYSTEENGTYSKVNGEPILEPGYRHTGVEPGVYFYYVTLVNTGNLEGDPGPVTSVEVKGTDYLTVFGNYGSEDVPLEKAMDMAVLPQTNEIVVVDESRKCLAVYSPMGVFKREIGSGIIGGPEFEAPRGIGVSADGSSVYVVDSGKARVMIFNENLTLKSTFGGEGTSEGYLTGPTDAAVLSDGTVMVTDSGNNRIERYTPSGTYLGLFGNTGTETQRLSVPTYIVATPEDKIYVTDSGKQRVVLFTNDFAFDGEVAFSNMGDVPPLESPAGLALDTEGKLFVADCGRNRILAVTATGEYDYLFGSRGYEHGEFGTDSPQGLAYDPLTGLLYAADTINMRIEVFQP